MRYYTGNIFKSYQRDEDGRWYYDGFVFDHPLIGIHFPGDEKGNVARLNKQRFADSVEQRLDRHSMIIFFDDIEWHLQLGPPSHPTTTNGPKQFAYSYII